MLTLHPVPGSPQRQAVRMAARGRHGGTSSFTANAPFTGQNRNVAL